MGKNILILRCKFSKPDCWSMTDSRCLWLARTRILCTCTFQLVCLFSLFTFSPQP